MYVIVEKCSHFNIWENTANGCKECYVNNIDPNEVAADKQRKSKTMAEAQKKLAGHKKRGRAIIIPPRVKNRY